MGLEIIRLGLFRDIGADLLSRLMPMLDLIVDGFFADLFAVLLVQPCVRTPQAWLSFVSLVELVQVMHVVSSVLVKLADGRGQRHQRFPCLASLGSHHERSSRQNRKMLARYKQSLLADGQAQQATD